MAVRSFHLVAAAVLLTAAGCKSHRTSAHDASAPAPHISKNKSNLVDWKTACGLGTALGMPTGQPFPTPVPNDEHNSLGNTWNCISVLAHNGVMFEAWGDNLDGANCLQLLGPAGGTPMRSNAYRRHLLASADKLTEKVVGQPVPAMLRQALLASPKGSARKTVKLKGWTLVVVRPNANTYEYTIYSD